MSLTLYRVIGVGNVIGTQESETKNYHDISYPGEVSFGGRHVVIMPLVPSFVDDRSKFMKSFMIPKHLVFYSAKINDRQIEAYYFQFVKDIIKLDSGIAVVDSVPDGLLPKSGIRGNNGN